MLNGLNKYAKEAYEIAMKKVAEEENYGGTGLKAGAGIGSLAGLANRGYHAWKPWNTFKATGNSALLLGGLGGLVGSFIPKRTNKLRTEFEEVNL